MIDVAHRSDVGVEGVLAAQHVRALPCDDGETATARRRGSALKAVGQPGGVGICHIRFAGGVMRETGARRPT